MEGRADLRRVDCRLAVTDSPYKELPWLTRCRAAGHNDGTQSMAVYRDHICCYGCGLFLERRMDSLAFLLGVSVNEAIGRARDYYEREKPIELTQAKRLSPALATTYQHLLWHGRSDRIQWLVDRGLSEATIKQAMIGHDTTRFTIPIWNQAGELISIRFRRDDLYGTEWWDSRNHILHSVPKYSGLTGHNQCALFPSPDHFYRHCFLTEGEFDALRLRQEGYNAITVTNGAGSLSKALELLPATIDTLYICGDQDDTGRKASRQVFVEATKRGLAVALADWDLSWGKDATDLYLGGHDLDQVKWLANGEMALRRGHPTTTEFELTA